MAAGWVSVIALRPYAREVGVGWMVFGVGAYVVYRRYVQGVSLTQEVEVPERPRMTDVNSLMSRMTGLPELRPLDRIGVQTAEERYAEVGG